MLRCLNICIFFPHFFVWFEHFKTEFYRYRNTISEIDIQYTEYFFLSVRLLVLFFIGTFGSSTLFFINQTLLFIY